MLCSQISIATVSAKIGRWRLACVMAAFLHASARRRSPETNAAETAPIVLLHDCPRDIYHRVAVHSRFTVEPRGDLLCQFIRHDETTDAQIYDTWLMYKDIES